MKSSASVLAVLFISGAWILGQARIVRRAESEDQSDQLKANLFIGEDSPINPDVAGAPINPDMQTTVPDGSSGDLMAMNTVLTNDENKPLPEDEISEDGVSPTDMSF